MNLIDRLTAQEVRLQQTAFIAPCVRGGTVRVRVQGLVYAFRPVPAAVEGWGVFRPVNAYVVAWVEAASTAQVRRYLRLFPMARWLLVRRLRGASWLAVPANAEEVQHRFGVVGPAVVHLAEGGMAFAQVTARWDGAAWWFERLDPRANPRIADVLRDALHTEILPGHLRCKGLTPEQRTAYEIAFAPTATARARRRHQQDTRRLRGALATGGGTLETFHDTGTTWRVAWATSSGERHTSIIAKDDLTVIGAGICLDDQDRDFDLASLVAVVEQRPGWL